MRTYLFIVLCALLQQNLVLSLCVNSQAGLVLHKLILFTCVDIVRTMYYKEVVNLACSTCFRRFRLDSSKLVDLERLDGSESRFSFEAVRISNWREPSGKYTCSI